MGQPLTQNFPAEQQYTATGVNTVTTVGSISDGFPTVPKPVFTSAGTVVIPPKTANANTTPLNFKRGYIVSYNLTLERELPGGAIASAGYVGSRVIDMLGNFNFNHGTLGGGAASQPLNTPALQNTSTANVFQPIGNENFNSLQTSLNKPLSHGFFTKIAYTWSRDIVNSFANGILIPSEMARGRNKAVSSTDRTHNFIVTGVYELPFGPNKTMVNHGVGAQVIGGWSLSSTFNHLSGTPFTIAGSAASCNCPGSTQRADQVASPNKVGRGVFGQPYFNPLAFKNVTAVRFGTAQAYSVRGPGYTNIDASLNRNFHVRERVQVNFRADLFNVANHAHFANPGTSLSSMTLNADGSVKALNGYDTITSTSPIGRSIDQRYFRLGAHLTW
jgi:hypothetical protein